MDDTIQEIPRGKGVDKEKRLHDWSVNNISFISDDLLVIGREVATDLGKYRSSLPK